MKKPAMKGTAALLGIAAMIGLSACAPTAADPSSDGSTSSGSSSASIGNYKSDQEMSDAYDTTKLCGDKPIKIGSPMIDSNAYSQVLQAMIVKEAKKCPNVTIQPTNAQANPTTENSNINSLVAQGADAIISHALFGPSELPAFARAIAAGVPVITYVSDPQTTNPKQVTKSVLIDYPPAGHLWADFLNKALKGKGTVVFLGGGPNYPISNSYFDALKGGMSKYPGLKLVSDEIFPTGYTAANQLTTLTGVLAKYGRVDAVVTDSGGIDQSIIQAYQAAGFKPPAVATVATNNGMNCAWAQSADKFPYFSLDGNNGHVAIALRLALAEVNGLKDPEPTTVNQFTQLDSLDPSLQPKCNPSASPNFFWKTTLTDDEMATAVG